MDGIACIAYMTASADIIGVQDIEPEERSVFILRHPAVGLGSEKIFPGRFAQRLFLRKGNAFLNHFIPDAGHRLYIGIFILSYCDFPMDFLPDFRFFLHIHRYDQTRRLIVPLPERGAVLP